MIYLLAVLIGIVAGLRAGDAGHGQTGGNRQRRGRKGKQGPWIFHDSASPHVSRLTAADQVVKDGFSPSMSGGSGHILEVNGPEKCKRIHLG